MKMVKLTCPYCGATLSVENGLDIFYCQYCGGKIMLTGQDSNIINAKVKLKEFEHKERLQQNQHSFQERVQQSNQNYELNKSTQNMLANIFKYLAIMVVALLVCLVLLSLIL